MNGENGTATPPKLLKVYTYLKGKNKVKAATYEEFETSMADPVKLEKVFNYLKSNNQVKSNTVDEFSQAVGLKKKDESLPPIPGISPDSSGGSIPALQAEAPIQPAPQVAEPLAEEETGVPLEPVGIGLMGPDQQRNELEKAAASFEQNKNKTPEQMRFEKEVAGQEQAQIKEEIIGGGDYLTPQQESERMDPVTNIGQTGWNVISSQIPSAFASFVAQSHKMAEGRTLDPQKKAEYKEMQKSALKLSDELQARGGKITANTIKSIDDIKDPWDAFIWGLNAVTQAGIQIPLSVATGGVSSLIQETGSIYLDSVKRIAQEKGITPDEVIDQNLDEPGAAMAYGAAAALLDRFGAGQVMGAREAFKQGLRQRAKALIAAGATEGHTEYTQTWLEQIGARHGKGFTEAISEVAGNDKLRKERIEAWAQGLTGGAGVSSAAFTPDKNIMEKIVQPKPQADEKQGQKGQEEVLKKPAVKEESKVTPQPTKKDVEPKPKEDAVPKRSTAEVPVEVPTKGGKEVGTRKPATEKPSVPQKEVKVPDKEEVKPIRQLGTGANVYFEKGKHRVNDDDAGKVLFNVGSKKDLTPAAHIEFDNASDAVKIAERVSKDYPEGVPDALLVDKYIDGLKKELLQKKEQQADEKASDLTDDKNLEKEVGDVNFKLIKKYESQLGEGVINRRRLVDQAKKIAIIDKKQGLPVEAVAEAAQYDIGYTDDFSDLKNAIKKGGIGLNKENVERMIDVGIKLPKEVIDNYKGITTEEKSLEDIEMEEEPERAFQQTFQGYYPNENGVFTKETAPDIERLTLKNKKKDWQGAPDAEIEVVQLDDKKWISTHEANTNKAGMSSPLTVSGEKFSSKGEAIKNAADTIYNWALREGDQRIMKWATEHGGEKYPDEEIDEDENEEPIEMDEDEIFERIKEVAKKIADPIFYGEKFTKEELKIKEDYGLDVERMVNLLKNARNLTGFKEGDKVRDVYSDIEYEIGKTKSGVAKLKNLETGGTDDFNVTANYRFIPAKNVKKTKGAPAPKSKGETLFPEAKKEEKVQEQPEEESGVRKEKPSLASNVRKKYGKVEPQDVKTVLQQYFATGGTVNSEEAKQRTGFGYKDVRFFTSKTGKSYDDLVQMVRENLNRTDENLSEDEVISAIDDMIVSGRKPLFEDLRQRLKEQGGEIDDISEIINESASMSDEMQDSLFNDEETAEDFASNYLEKADEEAVDSIIDSFTDTEGNTDWEGIQKALDNPLSKESERLDPITKNVYEKLKQRAETKQPKSAETKGEEGAVAKVSKAKPTEETEVKFDRKAEVEKAQVNLDKHRRNLNRMRADYDKSKQALDKRLTEGQGDMFRGTQAQGMFDDRQEMTENLKKKKAEVDAAQEEVTKAEKDLESVGQLEIQEDEKRGTKTGKPTAEPAGEEEQSSVAEGLAEPSGTGRGPEPGGATGSTGLRTRPALVYATKEYVTPPAVVTPATYNNQIDEHQALSINMADNRFNEGGKGFLLADGTGVGKELHVEEPILTENGWVRIGDIQVGDKVYGRDGELHNVTGVFPQGVKPLYNVIFSDNTKVLAGLDHQWAVQSENDRTRKNPYRVLTTRFLLDKVNYIWSVPTVEPIQYQKKNVILDPYIIGVLIGDGSLKSGLRFVPGDARVAKEVSKVLPSDCKLTTGADYGTSTAYYISEKNRVGSKGKYRQYIRDLKLNVSGEHKFIPADYLYNDVESRKSLLAGLLDTDGMVMGPRVRYSTTSEQLSKDVLELARSLGFICTCGKRIPVRTNEIPVYTIVISNFTMSILRAVKDKGRERFVNRNRTISSIDFAKNGEAVCISVDATDSLYITRDFIVTHNTRQIIGIADQRSKKGKVLIVTENETIIEDAFKKDAKAMNVNFDKIELGTYRSLADKKIGQGEYDTVIYDEAHNLKNADAAKTRAHEKVKSKHKVYATATPMDKHSGAAYFISNVLNVSEKEAYAMMGLNVDYKEIPPGSGNIMKKVTLMKGMSPSMINNNILRIRDDMMKIGSMIRREYPFYGSINESVLPATQELADEQSQIEDFWDAEIEEAFESGNPRKAGNLIGQKILESGRWNEKFKIDYAYKKAKEYLKQGNQVIIVAETVNEVTIKGLGNQKFPGTLSSLSEQFEKDGIKHARIFGDKPKINEVKKFQEGEVKLALMTPQSGGPQPYSANVLTPNGWVKMGSLSVGDFVIAADGTPTRVNAIFEQGIQPVFSLTTASGANTRCTSDHLWRTRRWKSEWQTKNLLFLMSHKHREWMLPINDVVHFSNKKTTIDPYLLGLLLGDGSFRGTSPRFCSTSDEIISEVQKLAKSIGLGFNFRKEKTLYNGQFSSPEINIGDRRITKKGWVIKKVSNKKWGHVGLPKKSDRKCGNNNPLTKALKDIKLWGLIGKDKFIPNDYLVNSAEVRLNVLRGLMDTDGTVGPSGDGIIFCNKSEHLANGVAFITRSLGGVATVKYRLRDKCYYVSIGILICPFKMEVKANRWKKHPHLRMKNNIKSIVRDGEEPCRCLLLDHSEHLYITDDFIVTHNTGINLDDIVGDAPRKMIVVTPNFSGDKFQQVTGRVSRRNTKSPADVELVYTRSNTDAHRKKTVDNKLEVLRAIQSGKLAEEAMNLEGIDNTGDPKNTDTKKPTQITIMEISPMAIGVTGDTYPIKDKLRTAGGKWMGKYKAWMFPKAMEPRLREMLAMNNGKNPQAQHAANRWDGRSIHQIQQAAEPITQVGLDKLVKRLQKKFKGMYPVVTDKTAFTQAWEDYLKNGGQILLQETSQASTRDGKPIGFSYDTDKVARERFNIPALEKIGSGSDRDVFDLGDGRVLKVAKTARGLEQNTYEGDWMLKGIIPEVFERGVNYVVTEKVDQATAKATSSGYVLKEMDGKWGIYAEGTDLLQGNKQYDNYDDAKSAMTAIEDSESEYDVGPARNKLNQMLRELKQFAQVEFDDHGSELQDVLEKWELSDILNYEVLWGDFTARRNWGFNKNGDPIHLDGGTFGGVRMIERYRKKKNLDDADFRDIYYKSKQIKREFKDKDKFTMFQAPKPGGLPNGFVYLDKIYINPDTARIDTPIHEFGHLWVETLKNSEYHKPLYRAMANAVKNSPYHKEVLGNPNYAHLTDQQALDEALATGIGERGARLVNRSRWEELWNDFVDFLRSVLGLKKAVNFNTFTVNDYMDLAAHELLSAGEVGSITSFHLPETMTFRLKHHKLPAEAWAQWRQRVAFEQVRSANPEGWSHTILGQSEQMMSEFMQLIQDKTRYVKMMQESIVDFYTNKTVEAIQKDPALSDAQKKKAIVFTKANKKAIREAVLGDEFDIHGQMDLASGKVKTRFDEIRDKWLGKPTSEEGYGPMMRFLTLNTDWRGRVKVDKESYGYKLAQSGINPLDLGTYAAALHIPERNEYYRAKDPNTVYQSGVTDVQATEYLKIFQQDPEKLKVLEDAYKAFRKDFIEAPLKAQLDAGLINQEQYDSLAQGFNNTYVPWKVSEFQSISKSAQYTGNMSSGSYNKIKALTPRGQQYGFDQRVNPFIAAMTAYEETLANIEKNRMLNNMADLIKLHPDKNFWEVKHIPYKVSLDVATGKVSHTLMIPESEAAKIRSNGIKFMKDGKPRWILIHDEYLNKSLKGVRAEKPNMASRFFLNMMRSVMNYMRLTQTALNIDFIFTNPLRDIQDAGINIQEYETKGLARKIFKGLVPSIKTIYEYETGSMDPNSKMGKYLMEMKEAGGEIAWLNFEGVEEVSQDIQREIESFNQSKQTVSAQALAFPLRAVLKSVVMSNKVMEQHIRLSTYVALREKGFSEQKAALGAKNVTINFNKRGEQKLLSSLYLYINPAIQGQVRNLTAIARSKTVRKMLVGYMIGNIINRALLDAFDDDEEKDWKLKDKLNDNDHSNNIILFNFLDPAKPLKIPLSYNLKPWKALSDATYEVATDQKSVGQATTKVLKNFAESLVPMSGSYFLPTIAELPVEVFSGVDTFTGRTFVPTDDISKKDSELYYSNASPTAIKIAKEMGEWNEGTDDLFEIHPGTIDHVMDWSMGGMKSYMRTPEEMIRVINSDNENKLKELDLNKIAIIRRFVTDLDNQPSRDKDKYYRDFETLMKNPTTKAKYEEYVKLVKKLVDKGMIKSTVARRKLKDIRKQQKERWNVTLDRIVVLKNVPLDLDEEDD